MADDYLFGAPVPIKTSAADRIDALMPSRSVVTPKDRLADALHIAWQSYVGLFGEPPHGTLPQMKALVAFIPDSFIGEPAKPGITMTQASGGDEHG